MNDAAPGDGQGAVPGEGAVTPPRLEALLLAAQRPLAEPRLVELLEAQGEGAEAAVRRAIANLNETWEHTERAFRAERVAGGWQLMTLSEHDTLLERLHESRHQSRISPAAMETLAIVAYRQPVMRAEIEAIRGVSTGDVLRGLLERRLVKVTGRAEEIGRPMLYGTTNEFLRVFGLSGIDDLPAVNGLRREPSTRTAPAPDDLATPPG